jgi:hypothetical protein
VNGAAAHGVPTQECCVLHHRETLRPRALSPWLPAVIARRLKSHLVERLADIRDLLALDSITGALNLLTTRTHAVG